MKIDVAARQRIINERSQKNLINQLVSSLKPPEREDTVTEPLTRVAEGVNRGGNISTILVAFVQSILKLLKEIKDSSPTSSDLKDIKKIIKKLNTVQGDSKNAPELDVVPIVDAIKEIKVDLQDYNNKALKMAISPLIVAINKLNENVIILTKQITDSKKDSPEYNE